MIGRTIKYIRCSKGLTQSSLAQTLNIGRSTLSDYEREKTDINFETIEQIAKVCGFEVIFRNLTNREEITSKNIQRKDIQYEQIKKA